MSRRRYNRAVGIAEFIIEGHTISDVKEEFRISKDTVERDLRFLLGEGFGEEAKRNLELYKKAKLQLHKNQHSKSKKVV